MGSNWTAKYAAKSFANEWLGKGYEKGKQKTIIESTAQTILETREKYPNASRADLYGNISVFSDLMKAHRANDAAVLEAYGFPKDATESDIVARLFKMYQMLIQQK